MRQEKKPHNPDSVKGKKQRSKKCGCSHDVTSRLPQQQTHSKVFALFINISQKFTIFPMQHKDTGLLKTKKCLIYALDSLWLLASKQKMTLYVEYCWIRPIIVRQKTRAISLFFHSHCFIDSSELLILLDIKRFIVFINYGLKKILPGCLNIGISLIFVVRYFLRNKMEIFHCRFWHIIRRSRNRPVSKFGSHQDTKS